MELTKKKNLSAESTEGSITDDVYVMERNLTTSLLTDFMKWINDTLNIVIEYDLNFKCSTKVMGGVYR
jgi:hypothetical protein